MKTKSLTSQNPPKAITASNFSMNGRKGKPARPKGMNDSEWFKVIANARIPKVLKGMQGIARLASLEGGEYTEKQAMRIIRDLKHRLALIEEAFSNPEKPIKQIESRYFE